MPAWRGHTQVSVDDPGAISMQWIVVGGWGVCSVVAHQDAIFRPGGGVDDGKRPQSL